MVVRLNSLSGSRLAIIPLLVEVDLRVALGVDGHVIVGEFTHVDRVNTNDLREVDARQVEMDNQELPFNLPYIAGECVYVERWEREQERRCHQ